MALENLIGTKYIQNLNENWPSGSDDPSAGDDHIRGIKNVLKRQFPNLGAEAVTLTAAELNRGTLPSGTRTVFYQAAAPTGWSRVTGIAATQLLRVVDSATDGGTSGGTDDPVLNNKVPAHNHSVLELTTGLESASHVHTGTTSLAGSHVHTLAHGSMQYYSGGDAGWAAAGNGTTTVETVSTEGDHQHTMTTSGVSANHTHQVPAHNTLNNASPANWTPRYLDVILCEKD